MLNIPQSLVLKWNKDYPILFISLLEFVRLPNFVNCVLFLTYSSFFIYLGYLLLVINSRRVDDGHYHH